MQSGVESKAHDVIAPFFKFSVPRFVILTVKAYTVFAQQKSVMKPIRNLRHQISANGNVKTECIKCEQQVSGTQLPEQIRSEASLETFLKHTHAQRERKRDVHSYTNSHAPGDTLIRELRFSFFSR